METIYIYNGESRISVPVTDSAERSHSLQQHNYVKLVWKSAENTPISANAYIEYEGQVFYCLDDYFPTHMDGIYEYDIEFHAIEDTFNRPLFFRYVDVLDQTTGQTTSWKEIEWSLNSNLRTIAEIVVDSLNRAYDNAYFALPNDSYADTLLLSYSFASNSIADALSTIAEQNETEWWLETTDEYVDGKRKYILHFDKCELGDTIGLNDNYTEDANGVWQSGGLKSVSQSGNTNIIPQKLYVYGSERNIIKKTVEEETEGGKMNVSYDKKLRLPSSFPNGTKEYTIESAGVTLSLNDDSSISIGGINNHFEKVKIFDEVYPKMDMEVTAVSVQNPNSENPIYWLKGDRLTSITDEAPVDGSINPGKLGLLIEGCTLMCTFTSGLLNGREFECSWRESSAEIGLIPIDENDVQIPSGVYKPNVGDTFILWNLAMPQSSITIAQNELCVEAINYIEELATSITDTDCVSEPEAFRLAGYDKQIQVGQRITVESDVFRNGKLASRIIKFSYKLTKPYDISFTLASSRQTGRLATLQNLIADVTHEVHSVGQVQRAISRRQWHDTEEMMSMLDSIQKQMVVVGDENNAFTTTCNVELTSAKIKVSEGYIQHQSYTENDWKGAWLVGSTFEFDFTSANANTPFYLYFRANKNDNSAICGISHALPQETDDFYVLNFGIVSSEYEGERVFNQSSGLTSIAGGTITTDVIQDPARRLVIDYSNATITARNGATIRGAIQFEKGEGENDLGTAIDNLLGGVNDARNTANSADSKATQAQNTANTANSTANSANAKAAQAQTTATNAQNAINNLKIGGTNLLLKSDVEVSNANYQLASYNFTTTPIVGNDYTITIWGQLGEGKTHFWCFNSSGTVVLGSATLKSEGVYSVTFKWTNTNGNGTVTVNPTKLYIYSAPNSGTDVISTIQKIKLEEGNISTSWTPAPEDVEQAIADAEDRTMEALANEVETINGGIEALQKQVDGEVTSWFLEGAPTLTNAPAKDWTTDEEKLRHEGDTYTDITTFVDSTTTPTAGQSWRWCNVDDEYGTGWHWHKIADSDAVKALAEAGKAQATADGKSTTFVVQPSNYSKGDLWILASDTTVNGTSYKSGTILTANEKSTTFVASHWGEKVKYTDDTVAQQAMQNAQTAFENAQQAVQDATNAKNRLDNWASDSVISPTEKQGIKDEIARIVADKEQITAEYTKYSLGTPTAFNTAYTDYYNQLVELSAPTPESITIPTNFATNQTAYYTERTNALNAISDGANLYAESYANNIVDNLQIGGLNMIGRVSFENDAINGSITDEKLYGENVYLIEQEAYSQSPFITYEFNEQLKGGVPYVLSFYSKSEEIFGFTRVMVASLDDEPLFNGNIELSVDQWGQSYAEIHIEDDIDGFKLKLAFVEASNIYISCLKLQAGDIPTVGYEATSSDVQEAKDSIDAVSGNLDDVSTQLEDAFKDGYFNKTEQKALKASVGELENSYNAFVKEYLDVANSKYLDDVSVTISGTSYTTPKTSLTTKYNALVSAYNNYHGVLQGLCNVKFGTITKPNIGTVAEVSIPNTDSRLTSVGIAFRDTYLTAYTSRVSEYKQALSVAQENIRVNMQKESKELVDNLQIGGRNLLLDSKSLSLNDDTNNNYKQKWYFPTTMPTKDKTYTFSCKKSQLIDGTATEWHLIFHASSGGNMTYKMPFSDEPQTKTVTIGSNKVIDGFLIYAGLQGSTAGNNCYWEELKLEEGNKATGWTPAPEDVDADIQEAKKEAQDVADIINSTDSLLNKSLSDGYIDANEREALNKSLEALTNEMEDIMAEFDNVSSSNYLTDEQKSTLNDSYTILKRKHKAYYSAVYNLVETSISGLSLAQPKMQISDWGDDKYKTPKSEYESALRNYLFALSIAQEQMRSGVEDSSITKAQSAQNLLSDSFMLSASSNASQSKIGYLNVFNQREIIADEKYTFSVESSSVSGSGTKPTFYNFGYYDYYSSVFYSIARLNISNSPQSVQFTMPIGERELEDMSFAIQFNEGKIATSLQHKLFGLMLVKGNTYYKWKPASQAEEESLYMMKDAMEGSTEIEGGLVMTNLIELKNQSGVVTAGISGLSSNKSFTEGGTSGTLDSSLRFWAGANLAGANTAPFRVYNDGRVFGTHFYGFHSALPILSASALSSYSKGTLSNGGYTIYIIDIRKTGSKILLGNLGSTTAISLPTPTYLNTSASVASDLEYIGSEIEIYNPFSLKLHICGCDMPDPEYCNIGNMTSTYGTTKPTTHYGYPASNPVRWTMTRNTCSISNGITYKYAKFKCIKYNISNTDYTTNIQGYTKFSNNGYYVILWVLVECIK